MFALLDRTNLYVLLHAVSFKVPLVTPCDSQTAETLSSIMDECSHMNYTWSEALCYKITIILFMSNQLSALKTYTLLD